MRLSAYTLQRFPDSGHDRVIRVLHKHEWRAGRAAAELMRDHIG